MRNVRSNTHFNIQIFICFSCCNTGKMNPQLDIYASITECLVHPSLKIYYVNAVWSDSITRSFRVSILVPQGGHSRCRCYCPDFFATHFHSYIWLRALISRISCPFIRFGGAGSCRPKLVHDINNIYSIWKACMHTNATSRFPSDAKPMAYHFVSTSIAHYTSVCCIYEWIYNPVEIKIKII